MGSRLTVGAIVDVLEDPRTILDGELAGTGMLGGKELGCRNGHGAARVVSKYQFGPDIWWIRTDCLLRLPPDDEMESLTRTKGRPKPKKSTTTEPLDDDTRQALEKLVEEIGKQLENE